MEHRHTEGPTRSPLSVCLLSRLSVSLPFVRLSVCQFGICFRNGSLVFSVFCMVVDNWNIQKLTESFSRKIHFAQKWPQDSFFWIFWKISSLVFPGNNLKWKLLLLIFHHQSHVWQSSGSGVMAKMLSANQIAGFFEM